MEVVAAAEGAEAVNQKQSEKTPSALSKQVLKHNTHCNTQLAHTKEAQSARAHAKEQTNYMGAAEATQYYVSQMLLCSHGPESAPW